MSDPRVDEASGVSTVGHEWDGIEELNNPLPRWWLLTLYASIIYAIGYVVVYPAIPLLDRGTEGLWQWTSRGALAAEVAGENKRRGPLLSAIAATPVERLADDPALMQAAVAGGRAAFRVNCVQCHGAGAAGSPAGNYAGYPNLNDDDWLWGGNLQEIEYTITHGIRQQGNDKTRNSLMPSFGKDGILTAAQIADVTSHVRSLAGKEKAGASAGRGSALFAANCAACHGPDARGLRQFGAPNLADAISLYGGSRAAITGSITNAHAGMMPAWQGRLDPVTIKMLAAYVHSLGGGEDFSPAAATAPAASPPPAQAAADVQR